MPWLSSAKYQIVIAFLPTLKFLILHEVFLLQPQFFYGKASLHFGKDRFLTQILSNQFQSFLEPSLQWQWFCIIDFYYWGEAVFAPLRTDKYIFLHSKFFSEVKQYNKNMISIKFKLNIHNKSRYIQSQTNFISVTEDTITQKTILCLINRVSEPKLSGSGSQSWAPKDPALLSPLISIYPTHKEEKCSGKLHRSRWQGKTN